MLRIAVGNVANYRTVNAANGMVRPCVLSKILSRPKNKTVSNRKENNRVIKIQISQEILR